MSIGIKNLSPGNLKICIHLKREKKKTVKSLPVNISSIFKKKTTSKTFQQE